jgi:hypothetical protein
VEEFPQGANMMAPGGFRVSFGAFLLSANEIFLKWIHLELPSPRAGEGRGEGIKMKYLNIAVRYHPHPLLPEGVKKSI